MKTSYVFKNEEKESKFLGLFYDMVRLKEKRKLEEMGKNIINETASEREPLPDDLQSDGGTEVKESPPTSNEHNEPEPKEPQKRFKKWYWYVIIFAIIAFIVYQLSGGGNNKTDELLDSVARLYVSEAKTDVKDSITDEDLVPLYKSATECDSDSVISELDTISNYMQAKATLNNLGSADYDLSMSDLPEKVRGIKDSTVNYTVSGLATTISDRSTALLTEIDDYNNLKVELENMKLENYDDDKYSQLVSKVTHNPNRTELEGILETIRTEKGIADAKAEASAAKDKKEKKEAKKALKEAEEKQKDAQDKLDAIQKKLDEMDSKSESGSKETEETKSTTLDGLGSKVQETVSSGVDKASEKVEDEGGLVSFLQSILNKGKSLFE